MKCEVCGCTKIVKQGSSFACAECGIVYPVEALRLMKEIEELEKLKQARDQLQAYIEQSKKESSGNTFRCVRKKPEYRKVSTEHHYESNRKLSETFIGPPKSNSPKLTDIIRQYDEDFDKPKTYYFSDFIIGRIKFFGDIAYVCEPWGTKQVDSDVMQSIAKILNPVINVGASNYAFLQYGKWCDFESCENVVLEYNTRAPYNKIYEGKYNAPQKTPVIKVLDGIQLHGDSREWRLNGRNKYDGFSENLCRCFIEFVKLIAPGSVIKSSRLDYHFNLFHILLETKLSDDFFSICKRRNIALDLSKWYDEIISDEHIGNRQEEFTFYYYEKTMEQCSLRWYDEYKRVYADGFVLFYSEENKSKEIILYDGERR